MVPNANVGIHIKGEKQQGPARPWRGITFSAPLYELRQASRALSAPEGRLSLQTTQKTFVITPIDSPLTKPPC